MSLELILLALAAICLALALHPFITYPLSLMVLKKFWPHRPSAVAGAQARHRLHHLHVRLQ